ncbi:MAG: hypothetical protein ACLTSG_14530 [Lachnospiraceae bacterium]
MSLPSMLYGSGIGKYNQTSYGGYNHGLLPRSTGRSTTCRT